MHRVLSIVLAGWLSVLFAGIAIAAKGDCGQPTSTGTRPKTGAALTVLKAAVGQATSCHPEPCVCDIDGNGEVQVSDALRILKISVGQNLPELCPCTSITTTTTSTVTSTTTLTSGCFTATALTVIDNCTGLEWEKKNETNVNASYTWSSTGTAPDGTVFTVFLPELNTPPCYAGHCD